MHCNKFSIPSCSKDSPDELFDAGKLVRLCAESFDENGEPQNDFPHCLFMIGEWLMETTELMAQFIALYQEECEELGTRICYAIGYWIRFFPIHFDAHAQLCKLVERLKKMVVDDEIDEVAVNELDVSSVPSYAWLRNVSVRNPVSRHVSLCFEQWSPEDISNSMSHIDYKSLSRVTIPEIKKYIKAGKLNGTPILERSITVFNSISSWVQCMILSKSLPKQRAEIITKFVNVGKHLKKLNNFNTLMAVIGGVTHSNISRLYKTHSFLSHETKKELNSLTQLLSNHSNFGLYRKSLQETKTKFKIPIMGIHLKDLIAWNGNGPSFDKTGTITLKRFFQLANLLSHFLGVNRVAHNLMDPNMDLINTLKVSFDITYNENDIYDLSLKREPKTLLNFQSSSSKSVVFADWASGVCQAPDSDTVNKHIAAMVDAVFKHYDHDRDSYISKAEFEQIAGNFPFIDTFVAIDADRDGQISKSEMKTYFMNLNKQSTEFRRGFKHNFHETTFLTPTLCVHCNKLLWGLIRQGHKCKDCGLVVHECCKDIAVAECRRKRPPTTSSGSFSSWLSSPRTISASSNGSSNGSVTTPRKGIFLNYSFRPKNRTVSTVSESPSPEPPLTATSEPSVPVVVGNTLRSSFHRLIRYRKNRAKSETVDYYRENNNASPEDENPDTDNIASLACEEVFEDDSSISEPLTSEKSATKISPNRSVNNPQPHHHLGTNGSSRFPSRGFAHHKISTTSNGTRLSPTMETHHEMAEEECEEFGTRICYAIGYWIRFFPIHFDAHAQLCKLVERLKKMVVDDEIDEVAVNELDVSSVPSYAWLRNVSVRNPVSRHVSLCFEQWSPEDISNSMSHIDYKSLSRVTIPEIKKYIKAGKLNGTPILERSITVFNSISSWVQCMILSKSLPKQRAEIITKFVNVGKHLKKLNNFNTLMAVIGGVTHSNISRLYKTHSFLSHETKKELNSLTQLLSNHSNFGLYRKSLQETKTKFKIPIMGIHLKDLIAWNGNGPSFDKTGTITLKRFFQLANLLSHFLGVNRVAHNLMDPNMDLINTLKVSFDITYNENDIYDLSLKREPKTLLNFQSSSSKSVVFADWASGVCQAPDSDTVNKHIAAMVDAVFKHYDHDRDSYISKAEFEQIAGNFPFIDTFVAIDADRDGQISKSEMKTYFMNLNKQSTEFRRGFKHNFHETTFLTPTLCVHCNKLLWGLIRQGHKCKDCGLVVHECCKDIAVAECRRKRPPTTSSGSFSSWLSSPRTISASSNGSSNGSVTTPRKGIFLNYSFRPKNRTVSTVSESPSPEPPLTATSEPSVPVVVGNTLRSSFHRLIRYRKNRAKSETVDYYRENNNASPEDENPDTDNIASLACEEVFEDDSSISEPLTSEKSATKISPNRSANNPQPHHHLGTNGSSRFPSRGFAHHKISTTSNGTRLSPTMETHHEMAEVR